MLNVDALYKLFREFLGKLEHLEWLVNRDLQVYRYVCTLLIAASVQSVHLTYLCTYLLTYVH